MAQKVEKKSKYPISFALNARGILPSDFIGETNMKLVDMPYESECTHTTGFSFGGIVRTLFSLSGYCVYRPMHLYDCFMTPAL